jgi:hypothetical protein
VLDSVTLETRSAVQGHQLGPGFAPFQLQVGGPVTETVRVEGTAEVRRALEVIGSDAPELTKYPAGCGFCGYRKVRWCAGVEQGTD